MNENSEITSIETPMRLNVDSAPRIAMGMPITTQRATRGCRKRARTMTTSRRPLRPFRNSVSSRPRSVCESSCQTASVTPAGTRLADCSTYFLTASETAMTSWSPTRKTCTITAGLPSKRASRSMSSKPSTTRATSASVTRVPSRRVSTTISSNSGPRYA